MTSRIPIDLGTPSGEVGLDLIVGEAFAGPHQGSGEPDLAVQKLRAGPT